VIQFHIRSNRMVQQVLDLSKIEKEKCPSVGRLGIDAVIQFMATRKATFL